VRVLVVPNPATERSVIAARTIAGWLADHGYEPALVTEDAVACGMPERGVAPSEIGSVELVVALGGDGTVLKAVHLLGNEDVPILGVNLGRLGFLSGAESSEMEEALVSALAGEARVERRQTLQCAVDVGGRSAGAYRALNEVFVGRGGGARVVELQVAVNGVQVWRFVCDGVIVATPTGLDGVRHVRRRSAGVARGAPGWSSYRWPHTTCRHALSWSGRTIASRSRVPTLRVPGRA